MRSDIQNSDRMISIKATDLFSLVEFGRDVAFSWVEQLAGDEDDDNRVLFREHDF